MVRLVNFYFMPNDITIFNVDNSLNPKLESCNAYYERKENIKILFYKLFKLNKKIFRNKKICITSGDYPEGDSCYEGYDYKFSTTIDIETPFKYNFFPCPHSISWKNVNIGDAENMILNLINFEKPFSSNKIFWAGGPQHQQRLDYKLFSEKNKDLCETRMTDNSQQSRLANFISIEDHKNFKFLIDIQGQGYSARVKYLLATGRPLFIVKRKWAEHWHRLLIPWTHYVPVEEDFSDLKENINILNCNNNLYNEIAINAKKFVSDNILLSNQLPYILSTLK